MSRSTTVSDTHDPFTYEAPRPVATGNRPRLHEVGRGRAHRPLTIDVAPWVRRAGRNAGTVATVLSLAIMSYDAVVLTVSVALAGVSLPLAVGFVVSSVSVLAFTGSYRQRISPTVGEEIPALAARLAVPALVIGALASPASDGHQLLRGAALGVALLVSGRVVSYALIRRARRSGMLQEPTLIIGAGRQGVVVADTLKEHPEYGLIPVAFMDSFEDELQPPIVGDVDRLDEVLDGGWVRRVIIAFGATREAELVSILRAAERHRVEVHVLPRFFELGVSPSSGDTDVIWGIPLVRVRQAALRTAAWRSKRLLDLFVASVLLVLTAPLMAVAALAVKVASPGPILFRQRRVGQRGRDVEIFKFRTMPVNNDSDHTWTVDADKRLTPIGRFLRGTSIDELPQLFNVLRGDMSVVGPRPERPAFVDAFGEQVRHYGDRHRVPVGITGWAQIHRLRGDTSIEERARFDNYYIEHWSLWRDLLIIVRTLPAMLQHSPRGDDHSQAERR